MTKTKTRAEVIAFFLRFAFIACVLSFLYAFPYSADGPYGRAFHAYLAAYARLATLVIQVFDATAHTVGTEISGRFSVRITKDCDAMEIDVLLASAVFAFPATLPRKLTGFAAGTALVLVANLSRICALYFIGADAPAIFELAHRDLFPLILVALGTGFFIGWARNATSVPFAHESVSAS